MSAAREEARTTLYRATVKGEDPAQEKKIRREAGTFEELALEYIEKYAKPNKDSWREDQRIVDKDLLPMLGPMHARDVTRATMRDLLDRVAVRGKVMANRTLSLARRIFNWAIKRDLLEYNPCHKLAAPGGREVSRDRVLSDEEIKNVWDALNDESVKMGGLFKLRLLTAQRGGEVSQMKWADIDLDNAIWTIPAEVSKNGNMHRVPLSSDAMRILEALKVDEDRIAKNQKRPVSAWVFRAGRGDGCGVTELQKCIQRVRTASKVSFRGHDLRRTAASKMTESGVPRLIVKKILNHADHEVTSIYDRFDYMKEKREALEAWSRRVMKIVSGLKVAVASNQSS